MNIIRPAHGIPATKVKNWQEIKDQALEMKKLVSKKDFDGMYSQAYAISHAQVSNTPKWFFVINESIDDEHGKKVVDYFGSWCVVNAEIIESDVPVSWREACMSFPHRQPRNTDRFLKIKVRYQVPVLGLFLRWKTRRLEGLPAFLVQHEQDHATGRNIYGLNNKNNE